MTASDKSGNAGSGIGFVTEPAPTPEVERIYDEDRDGLGYVMNATRMWAHQPAVQTAMFDLIGRAAESAGLSFRERGILVTACASTRGDSYCSLAWGGKLAGEAGDDVAAAVLRGDDAALEPAERVLARWARQVVRDPNATRVDDVAALRDAGYDDARIVAITVFVALRLAFSTVNDALGAPPDHALATGVPAVIRDVVTFGRPAG